MTCSNDKIVDSYNELFNTIKEANVGQSEAEIRRVTNKTWNDMESNAMNAIENRILEYLHYNSKDGVTTLNRVTSDKTYTGTPVLVRRNAKGITVIMDDKTSFTFKNGAPQTLHEGKVVQLPMMANIEDKIMANFLGSDSNDAAGRTFQERVNNADHIYKEDLINNPENVQTMIDKLIEQDLVELDKDTVAMLKEVGNIVADPIKKYGKKMNVYVNNKMDQNGGSISFEHGKLGLFLEVGTQSPVVGNAQSAAEKYVHELVHAVTYYAVNYAPAEVSGTISRLKKLHAEVMPKVSWETFMPEVSINYEMEKEIAQARYDYLNSSKHSLEEFIAYAMTHKRFRDALSKLDAGRRKNSTKDMGYWDTLKEYVSRLIETTFERLRKEPKGMKADMLLMKLHKELMEANTLAVKGWNNKVMESVTDTMDNLEEKWGEVVGNIQDKLGDLAPVNLSTIPAKDEGLKGALWLIKNSWKMFGDPKARPYYSGVLKGMMFTSRGTVQTVLRHLSDTDSFQDKLGELGLMRNSVERIRMEVKETTKAVLSRLWGKRRLNKHEKKALTIGVLKTDLHALAGIYKEEELADLYLDGKKLDKAINSERSKVTGHDDREVKYKLQAVKDLAAFMVIGKSNVALQVNAHRINTMAGTAYEYGDMSEYGSQADEKIIDRLVTLEAIKLVDKDTRAKIGGLLQENSTAVLGYSSVMQKANEDSEGKVNRIKGWIREIYDDNKTSKIAPLDEEAELADHGYVLKKVIVKHKDGTLGKQMGLYVNDGRLMDNFNISAMGLTNSKKHTGTVIFDSAYHTQDSSTDRLMKERVKNIQRFRDKLIERVMDGKRDNFDHGENMVPIVDDKGVTTGYAYALTTKEKEEYLTMDMDPGEIVGTMAGSVNDREETLKLNNKLMKELFKNMDENLMLGKYDEYDENKEDFDEFDVTNGVQGKDGHNYVKIHEFSEEEYIRDLWSVIPGDMKKQIRAHGNKGLWVREDAIMDAFGFREGSIVDVPVIKQMYPYMKRIVKLAEKLWKSIISLAKADIVIRTPGVLIGNIVSNTMYLLQMGFNIKKVFTMQATGMAELNRYVKDMKRINELKATKMATGGLTTMQNNELKRLESTIETGSIKDLVDAGLYQAIVEDLQGDDIKTTNKVSRIVGEKLDDWGTPQVIKDGLNWVYLSEKTGVFGAMQQMTQYSDFMARYAMYHMSIEKARKRHLKKKGKEFTVQEMSKLKKDTIKEITNAFINYGKPDSVVLQWMNDVGLIMFTKYAIRIQKVWKDGIAKHPLRFMMAAMAQEIAYLDIDDITDKAITDQSLSDFFFTPEATDNIERALVPAIARMDDLLGSIKPWSEMR